MSCEWLPSNRSEARASAITDNPADAHASASRPVTALTYLAGPANASESESVWVNFEKSLSAMASSPRRFNEGKFRCTDPRSVRSAIMAMPA